MTTHVNAPIETDVMTTGLPDAKPSAVLKSMPREKWGQEVLSDGDGHYCALGWLGLIGECATSEELEYGLTSTYERICSAWELTEDQGDYVFEENDNAGLDAVITYLESIGR